MKKTVGIVTCLALVLCLSLPVIADDLDQARSNLAALLMEQRAINAEFVLYQAKLKEIQERAPQLQKDIEDVLAKVKKLEAEKKVPTPAPAKPAGTTK